MVDTVRSPRREAHHGAPVDRGREAAVTYDVVVPTIGRASLQPLVQALLGQCHRPAHVYVVDDRADATVPLDLPCVARLHVLRTGGRGAAAARNIGWRAGRSPWVVFVDDDIVVPREWSALLVEELGAADPQAMGVPGRVQMPLVAHGVPTDTEAQVPEPARAAYRRDALALAGGFDERYCRARGEDAASAARCSPA